MVPFTVASTCASMETSHTLVQTSPAPACVVIATASCNCAALKSTSVRRAPSCPRRFAAAKPMPLAAPVTMATLFSYRRMDRLLFGIFRRFCSAGSELPCLDALFERPFVAVLTGQDNWYLQAYALCRQYRAPGFNQRLVSSPYRPDVAFEIEQPECIDIAVVLSQRGIPVNLVGQRIPGKSNDGNAVVAHAQNISPFFP